MTTAPSANMKKVVGMPNVIMDKFHPLCPGCGEPIVMRLLSETIEQMGMQKLAVCVPGIGCYTPLPVLMNIDMVQALHGRAPSIASGVKRVRPETLVFTLQGDGDMVSAGINDLIHSAARGENVTAIILNNGLTADTGAQMTPTSIPGQVTKITPQGRDVKKHGHPIRVAEMISQLDGVAYVARVAVHTPVAIGRTQKAIKKAFETQMAGKGFTMIEILTMCPTGWYIKTPEGPKYIEERMVPYFPLGEFKTPEGKKEPVAAH